MIRTFIEFTLRATRNRLVSRLRRLKDPRYLVGGIAGLAYLWFVFFRNTSHLRNRPKVAALTGDVLVDLISIVILFIMIAAWALPADSGGLQFSEAEIAMLFPAPLRRRDLLLYKIIRAQPQALASAIFFFILGWRRNAFIGGWAALSVLGIYFMLVALGRARLKQLHVGFLARLVIVGAILTGFIALWTAQLQGHPFSSAKGYDPALLRQIAQFLHRGPLGAILFIPRLFATAAVPPAPVNLAVAIGGLLVLGAVLFFLAARLNVSFEEASIVASAKRAARLEAVRARQGGRLQVSYRRIGPLFRLGETGPAEVAIVWKNVIALVRTGFGIVVLLLVLVAFMIGLAAWAHNDTTYAAIGMLLMFLAGFFPLTGSQIFSNDLRLDMARSEILKSYPLSGERLVAAELAAPLVVVAALDLIFAISGSVFLNLSGSIQKTAQFAGTPQFIVILLILELPICAMLLLIRNAVPLYFPAWSLRSPDEPRSFVFVGQRIVVLLGNLMALVIALIPAGIVFLPSLYVAFKFFSGNAIFMAVATVPAAAVIVFELWLGIKLLGARFDAMDVSNEFDLMTV